MELWKSSMLIITKKIITVNSFLRKNIDSYDFILYTEFNI